MFGESSQGELSQGGDDGQGGGVVGGVGGRANHLFRELNPSGNVTKILCTHVHWYNTVYKGTVV